MVQGDHCVPIQPPQEPHALCNTELTREAFKGRLCRPGSGKAQASPGIALTDLDKRPDRKVCTVDVLEVSRDHQMGPGPARGSLRSRNESRQIDYVWEDSRSDPVASKNIDKKPGGHEQRPRRAQASAYRACRLRKKIFGLATVIVDDDRHTPQRCNTKCGRANRCQDQPEFAITWTRSARPHARHKPWR